MSSDFTRAHVIIHEIEMHDDEAGTIGYVSTTICHDLSNSKETLEDTLDSLCLADPLDLREVSGRIIGISALHYTFVVLE